MHRIVNSPRWACKRHAMRANYSTTITHLHSNPWKLIGRFTGFLRKKQPPLSKTPDPPAVWHQETPREGAHQTTTQEESQVVLSGDGLYGRVQIINYEAQAHPFKHSTVCTLKYIRYIEDCDELFSSEKGWKNYIGNVHGGQYTIVPRRTAINSSSQGMRNLITSRRSTQVWNIPICAGDTPPSKLMFLNLDSNTKTRKVYKVGMSDTNGVITIGP